MLSLTAITVLVSFVSSMIAILFLQRIFTGFLTRMLFTIVQSLVARLVLTNHPQKLPLSS